MTMITNINEWKNQGKVTENIDTPGQDKALDNASYDMYNDTLQDWVNDMWAKMEQAKPGFTEADVHAMTALVMQGFKELVDDNIQTYFHPETV